MVLLMNTLTYTLAKTLVQSTNLQEKGKTYCTPTILLVIFANHLAHNRREKGGKESGIKATRVASFPNIVVIIATFY